MKKTIKIIIPNNAAKLILLAQNILAKHIADGASSVLINQKSISTYES